MALIFTNRPRSLNVIPHTAAISLGPTRSAWCYFPPLMLPRIINPSERHLRCWRFLICWMTIGFRKSRFSTSKMTILWNSIIVFSRVPLLWNLVRDACGRETLGNRDIEWAVWHFIQRRLEEEEESKAYGPLLKKKKESVSSMKAEAGSGNGLHLCVVFCFYLRRGNSISADWGTKAMGRETEGGKREDRLTTQ